jgi:hypothetical protein
VVVGDSSWPSGWVSQQLRQAARQAQDAMRLRDQLISAAARSGWPAQRIAQVADLPIGEVQHVLDAAGSAVDLVVRRRLLANCELVGELVALMDLAVAQTTPDGVADASVWPPAPLRIIETAAHARGLHLMQRLAVADRAAARRFESDWRSIVDQIVAVPDILVDPHDEQRAFFVGYHRRAAQMAATWARPARTARSRLSTAGMPHTAPSTVFRVANEPGA